MLVFIIGKIIGFIAVANNKQLHKTHQGIAISVSRIIFIIHDLLHCLSWGNVNFFQLNLHHRQSINQQNNIIPMIAILGIDAQLIDNFIIVFAPIFYVYKGIMQWRPIFTLKVIPFTKHLRCCKHIRIDDFLSQT